MKYNHVFLVLVLLAAAAGSMRAGEWYGALEVGAVTHTFQPEYTYANGDPDESYTDKVRGTEVGFVVGYAFWEREWFGLAAQGRFSYNNADWELNVPDYYVLSKEARYAFSFSLVPSVKPARQLSLFAELGVGGSRIELNQTSMSPARSDYRLESWRPAFVVGGGVRYAVIDQLGISLQYRRTYLQEITFDIFNPDGTLNSTCRDAPHTDALIVGLSLEFHLTRR